MIKERIKTATLIPAQQEPLWAKSLDAIVETSDFPSREAVIEEALRLFFEAYPQLRLEMAIRLYQNDEVTLLRAAELAEVDFLSFQATLRERGIVIEGAGATKDEIDMGLAFLRGEL